MFFLYVYFRRRYHYTQILVRFPSILTPPFSQRSQGALICIAGLGLLVASDQLTGKDWAAVDKGRGDALMIIGSTLYGFSGS